MNKSESLKLTYSIMSIPQSYELVHISQVKHNAEEVIWLRFVEVDKKNTLGGEHLSIAINPHKKQLKGYMHIKPEFSCDVHELPVENEAKTLTFNFLKKHAPDIWETVEVRWIKPILKKPVNPPHDEGFSMQDGRVITGMRVKLWNNINQSYAWVIIGPAGAIVSFERDIVWDSARHCRVTERWLHDDWLIQQGFELPEKSVLCI